MPTISARDNLDEKKAKNKDTKEQQCDASYNESVRAKWFCCAFKLGFFQLTCKASSFFNF